MAVSPLASEVLNTYKHWVFNPWVKRFRNFGGSVLHESLVSQWFCNSEIFSGYYYGGAVPESLHGVFACEILASVNLSFFCPDEIIK